MWLPGQDEKTLTEFFAGIETAVGAALTRKIERHPLRPAAVAAIVEAARAKAEELKKAQKAEAVRKKEEWEREELNGLLSLYGPKADKATAAADHRALLPPFGPDLNKRPAFRQGVLHPRADPPQDQGLANSH